MVHNTERFASGDSNFILILMRSVCALRTLTMCNSRRGFLWKKKEVSSVCEV